MKTSAKTKLIIIFASVMACMMVATFTACDGADGKSEATEGLEYYLLPDNTFGVKAGTSLYLEKIVIPDSYKGKAVTQILDGAFENAHNLKEIQLPDSIDKIQSLAFHNCTALEKITIPDSVTSIGGMAFSSCSGLTSVTIGNSVTSIGGGAFYECSKLTSVTIPDSVTSIGNLAFDGCNELTSVTIGSNVTSIGNLAFDGCSGLTSVTIGSNVTSIDEQAFRGCSGLKSIFYKGNKTQWDNIKIDMGNDYLTIATRYYYSASKPTAEGNYWHYGSDGITPVIWKKD